MHSEGGVASRTRQASPALTPEIHKVKATANLGRIRNKALISIYQSTNPCCQTVPLVRGRGENMLQKSDDAAQARAVRTETRRRSAPTPQVAIERRRGQRLLTAWHTARGDRPFPSFADLEAAADSELMHHSVLVRVGTKGQLTIERFGPPIPTGESAARKKSDGPIVVTPLVVTWILSIAASALRRRAPVSESDEIALGSQYLCYRCAVVPISTDGTAVDSLVGILGYRWALDSPKPK